jgi:LmbE family N-acetylglucosaminyl deacetylase
MPDATLEALNTPDTSALRDPNAGLTPGSADSVPATPNTQPTEYWGKGILKEDGSFDHSRWEKAPDDIKDVGKDFSKFKTWDEVAKAWKGKNELLGKKGIAEPLAKDATPEARAEHMALVRRALGAPDKLEGYTIPKPEGLTDAQWDKAAVDAASKIAFEEGVSPAALQKLASFEMARGQQAEEARKLGEKEWFDGQDKLIREFAAKEGINYGEAQGYVGKACQRWGVSKDNPILKNATAFMLLARLGKAGGESPLIQGDTEGDSLRQHTPETAAKALSSIRDDSKNPEWFAYWNYDPASPGKKIHKPHPDHDTVVAKAKRLSALANANRK